MKWSVQLDAAVHRTLRKLHPQVVRTLRAALRTIAELEDPRSKGKPLTGPLKGYWSYRIGDYRIICDIQDTDFIIVAIDLGHRSRISDR